MLAVMHLTPIGDFADVEPVLEQMGERAHAEADTAALEKRRCQKAIPTSL
jgi:hypothetical protein